MTRKLDSDYVGTNMVWNGAIVMVKSATRSSSAILLESLQIELDIALRESVGWYVCQTLSRDAFLG